MVTMTIEVYFVAIGGAMATGALFVWWLMGGAGK